MTVKSENHEKLYPISRRSFLGGLGSIALSSATAPSFGALVTAGSISNTHPIAPAPLNSFLADFAPSEGFVKPSERPHRDEVCLNGAWKFRPVALPDDFQQGRDPGPELVREQAKDWDETPLWVPSPWNVNSFADHQGQGGDFRCYPSYPAAWEKVSMGWLSKTVTVPAHWKGRRIILRFDAVAGYAEIVVNGKTIGSHFDIFLPFEFDVTDAVVTGANEIQVGIRKSSLFDRKGDYGRRTYQGGSFWGQHIAGIWQDAFLLALPTVRVADVYIKPHVDKDILEADVVIQNDGDQEVDVVVGTQIFLWKSKAGDALLTSAMPSSELESNSSLELPHAQLKVPAHGTKSITLQAKVDHRLKPWNCSSPSLYGLVVQISRNGSAVDRKYTRFGWRQITLKDSAVLLNGDPMILHGDSWHFMGIPQMTRRYAWAWFTALHHAGLNAIRLHAQPYPAFYLDVADEMGILVLDETAIWASDGGPKLDDPVFWKDTERHIAGLVLRDRNHPSVFGWSVSNEIIPIVRGVMRNPPGMVDELVRHYGIWADICRRLDPTRQWISADGEDDGQGVLPVYIVHYGGAGAMQRAAASGKPWGVGEAGNAYYGTPVQVAETNGERAYESFEGRMEGVAISSYQSLIAQRENKAIYRSVFNLVWYALQPLPFGMKDTSRPPQPADGIFFPPPVEGKPGVQPQRIGPYSSTLNPGYDAALPLYQTWPLFEAIRDAAAEPPISGKWSRQPAPAHIDPASPVPAILSARILAGGHSSLAIGLQDVGVPPELLMSSNAPEVFFIDGANPPGADARTIFSDTLQRGGTVFVWGADSNTLPILNQLLPAPLEITSRRASSLLPAATDSTLSGLKPSNLYFCGQQPPGITDMGLTGPLIAQSRVLLRACDTNWLLWNNQPEYAKTAMVLRSERETKPSGVVLAEKSMGPGRLLLTTLPSQPHSIKAEKINRTILTNLGLPLKAGMDSGKPLLRTGVLVRVLACGYFPTSSTEAPQEPWRNNGFRTQDTIGGRKWQPVFQESGTFDLSQMNLSGSSENAEAYLSFWVYSPRSLEDLLLEPDLPRVDFEVTQRDAVQVWLNESKVLDKPGGQSTATAEGLRLRAGWNHFFVRTVHRGGRWEFAARFSANRSDFVSQLNSTLEMPRE